MTQYRIIQTYGGKYQVQHKILWMWSDSITFPYQKKQDAINEIEYSLAKEKHKPKQVWP